MHCIVNESIIRMSVIEKNNIPMAEKFYEEKAYGDFSKYDYNDFESMQRTVNDLFGKICLSQNLFIRDIFFRIAEANHCFADVYNIVNGSFYSRWKKYGGDLNGLIDQQYLLYSGMFRCYACYDKLARYIASQYKEENGIKYFSDITKINLNTDLINNLKNIANSKQYQYLYELRNDIYHNLRLGCVYGDNGLEYYNMILFDVVFKNSVKLCEIITNILENI